MAYLATINVPGYLPMDDDPPVFKTAREAWEYLADERERSEADSDAEYSSALHVMTALGSAHNWRVGVLDLSSVAAEHRTEAEASASTDGQGFVYASTPGYEGDHDQGLAYSVTEVGD